MSGHDCIDQAQLDVARCRQAWRRGFTAGVGRLLEAIKSERAYPLWPPEAVADALMQEWDEEIKQADADAEAYRIELLKQHKQDPRFGGSALINQLGRNR
jgi:hypothetical protein